MFRQSSSLFLQTEYENVSGRAIKSWKNGWTSLEGSLHANLYPDHEDHLCGSWYSHVHECVEQLHVAIGYFTELSSVKAHGFNRGMRAYIEINV